MDHVYELGLLQPGGQTPYSSVGSVLNCPAGLPQGHGFATDHHEVQDSHVSFLGWLLIYKLKLIEYLCSRWLGGCWAEPDGECCLSISHKVPVRVKDRFIFTSLLDGEVLGQLSGWH